MTGTEYFAPRAWLSGEIGLVTDVTITVTNGRITGVVADSTPSPAAIRLPGLVIPGLVNAHSHVFHRALRGRTHIGRGDFWSWRDRMYTVVGRLDVERYRALATATYAEMALAGITTVVEFHYLRRLPGAVGTQEPSMVDMALIDAAAAAGIRLVLLDTCYLTADVDGSDLAPEQHNFTDGDITGFLTRMDRLREALPGSAGDPTTAPHDPVAPVRLGTAVHSVRGCPPEAMRRIAEWAREHRLPLHIHLSEQVRENERCLAVHGVTPTRLCADTGLLGPLTTAVHATHLTAEDIDLLGGTGTIIGMCPTTERDLADGVGPAAALAAAGSPLSLGSDSHAVIDLFEEARAVELDERLATQRRGHHTAARLLTAATAGGAAGAGLAGLAGEIRPGASADLVAVNTDSVRLAGAADPVAATVFAATTADVTHVVSAGRLIVSDGVHHTVGDVGAALTSAITPLFG